MVEEGGRDEERGAVEARGEEDGGERVEQVEGEAGGEGGGVEVAGGEVGGVEEAGGEGREEPIFYKTISVNGKRVFHYFLDKFYRFDRKKVKPNGRAYFTCSMRPCSAKMCADYQSKDTMEEVDPVPDMDTITPHHLHLMPDGSPHPIEVSTHGWLCN